MFDQQDELQERRLQHQLEIQSMQIEHVFNRHQVDAHVAGGTVKPRSIRFNLHTQLVTGLERLKVLTDDLMHTLGVPVSLSREDGQLRLDVSQPSTPPVSLLDLMSLLSELPPVTAVLGLAEDGRPILLDFTEQDMSHILLSGVSGAGKTALLRTLVMSLAMMNRQSRVQFVVFDGKSADPADDTNLHTLNYLPHMLADVMCHQDDVRHTLAFLTDELSYRLDYNVVAPTIVVIIDAVDVLLETGDSLIRDAIMSLVQRGSDVGVHLVMSTQQPQTAVLDNLFKANVSVQLVGRLRDSEQARLVTGLERSQAEFLLGQGDFLAIAGQYMTHFQAAFIGDYDLHLTIQELHRKRAPTLLAQSVEEFHPISLTNADMGQDVETLPQHFLYRGDTIALTNEELSSPLETIDVEDLSPEEDEDYDEEDVYVPKPVIRLFHDAPADEAEDLEITEEEIENTADSHYDTSAEESVNITDATTIFGALAKTRLTPTYKVQKKSSLKGSLKSEVISENPPLTNEVIEDVMDISESVKEEEVEVLAESYEPEHADEGEEEKSEYVEFEDDWLPFDDD